MVYLSVICFTLSAQTSVAFNMNYLLHKFMYSLPFCLCHLCVMQY